MCAHVKVTCGFLLFWNLKFFLLWLLALTTFWSVAQSASGIEWKPDDISIFHGYNSKGKTTVLNVTATANGPLDNTQVGGHFKVAFSFHGYAGTSDCISFTGDSSSEVKTKIVESPLVSSSHLFGKYFSVLVHKFYNDFNSTQKSTTTLIFTFISKNNDSSNLLFDISTANCSKLQTIGVWEDHNRWKGGKVPTVGDAVIIPENAGVIQLHNDLSVASIQILGGTIRAYRSGCSPSWTIDDGSLHTNKCFKLIDQAKTFESASKVCNELEGGGSMKRNLVQISDRNELDLIYRICRPSDVTQGCWIGLKDSAGDGRFTWIVDDQMMNSNVPHIFLDWRRMEPNNHTVSLGKESLGGERCGAIVPWIEDPLLEEQGGWNDDSCSVQKPFICQQVAETVKFRIKLSENFIALGGSLQGGQVEVGKKSVIVKTFSLQYSANFIIPPLANATIQNLFMTDGSKLYNYGYIHFSGGMIGENDNTGAQTVVQFGSQASVDISSVVNIQAKVLSSGIINVLNGAKIELRQGGLLAQSSLHLFNKQSSLVLAGYASRLTSWDSFELVVTHRGSFLGEFYGSSVNLEELNLHSMVSRGVYRLQAASGSDIELSECIPYNATIAQISNIINNIHIIKTRGGVSVRRYGDQDDSIYGYGFTYRIEIDSISTSHFSEGPIDLAFHCYGLSCSCADTKVKIIDSSGTSICPNPSNYSKVSLNSCVIPPSITVKRISSLAYLNTNGDGSIQILAGAHRLMPISNVPVVIKSGITTVSASVIEWRSLDISNVGTLVIAGTGWDGWDSSYLLFSPEWTDRRGIVSVLSLAPAANMSCQEFSVTDNGRVVTTGPGTQMFWSRGQWSGGIIGGQSDLYILDHISLAGAHKSLRYGMTVHVSDSATALWTNGNISLANGAQILVRGIFNISNLDSSTTVAIGEAHLLTSSSLSTLELMKVEPGRSWQSYFDRSLIPELRPAWYNNPLCGEKCLLINELYIEGNGQIIANDHSNSLFLLPLNIVGTSKFNVGTSAKVNLGSGGIFGNDVVVDLSVGTILELSGGRMKMEATCTIKGAGELIVTAGSHDLSFSVDAHITISGGALVWPESRGTQKTITFNGGLLIQGTGQMEVQPFSTTILIHEEVHLKDQSIIQFPLIGIAAQASPFDRSDAPDTSPRGNLTATGTMRWEGGTLRGKADFNALKELFLDGDVKYIKSLAKLVNKGHCEWGKGDIITSDNGDFQNFGTIQMRDGVSDFFSSVMYKGSELPVDNGGDYFALEYHSWDTDNGALDYTEYLQLRTRFVSRVPNGWTFESQK